MNFGSLMPGASGGGMGLMQMLPQMMGGGRGRRDPLSMGMGLLGAAMKQPGGLFGNQPVPGQVQPGGAPVQGQAMPQMPQGAGPMNIGPDLPSTGLLNNLFRQMRGDTGLGVMGGPFGNMGGIGNHGPMGVAPTALTGIY